MKWIIYWFHYVSSITGVNENSGVILLTADSVTTYIAPYQYTSFKIDYFKGDEHVFHLIASRPHCTLIIFADSEKIEQTIIMSEIGYKERAIMYKKVCPSCKKRNKAKKLKVHDKKAVPA